MKRFFNLFIADTKKLLYSKLLYVFFALCLIFSALTFILPTYQKIIKEPAVVNKSTYGIDKYESQQELKNAIDNLKDNHQNMITQLKEDVELENVTKEEIKNRQIQIDTVNRSILTAEYLYNHNISYANYNDYGFATYCNTDIKSEILYFYSLLHIMTIAIGVLTIIRAALYIPAEISSGRYKFMFTVPLSRKKYVIYRFLFLFLQSVAFLIIYSILIGLTALIMFGGNDMLIFGTSNYVFGLGYIPAIFFILLFKILNLFFLTLFAYGISLLISNKIISLLLTLLIYLGKDIVHNIINTIWFIFTDDYQGFYKLSKYFFTSNLSPLDGFTNITNSPFWLIMVITLAYLTILTFGAFFKFLKQDIKK